MAVQAWRARLAYNVVGAVLLALVGAQPAGAAPADRLIVFASDRGGHTNLWTMHSDGSGLTQLTDDKANNDFPDWSPNRRQIAWTVGGGGPAGEIWVMNADGTGRRQVTHNSFPDFDATWSPDGGQLVYRSSRGGEPDIFAIRVDGTGERQLTNNPARDFAPDWSPDGRRITFSSERSGSSAVYSMNATDGSDVRQLTPDAMQAAFGRYSPDGTKIGFVDAACGVCGEQDVFVMNTDGSEIRQVTNTPDNESMGGWFSKGTRVVVELSRVTPGTLGKRDAAVVTVATGATANLTSTTAIDESHPDGQP